MDVMISTGVYPIAIKNEIIAPADVPTKFSISERRKLS
jgi:hypothetical protein